MNKPASEISSNPELEKQLRDIIATEPDTVRAFVASQALDHHGPAVFLRDVANYGCSTGIVSTLIYYADTHSFFDKHYEEIEQLRQDFAYDEYELIYIGGDLKNGLAWFAVEETARQMANELGIEV